MKLLCDPGGHNESAAAYSFTHGSPQLLQLSAAMRDAHAGADSNSGTVEQWRPVH